MPTLFRSLRCRKQLLPTATMALACTMLAGLGCGTVPQSALPVKAAALHGRTMGGQQPIVGSVVQLYAAATTGDGGTATALIASRVVSDTYGNFDITGDYTCPTPTTQVYLIGTGGNPGLAPGTNNTALVLMAALGNCGSLGSLPYLQINEVTTVASVAALYPYMFGYKYLGSGTSDAAKMATAFSTVNQYVDIAQGVTPGPALPAGSYASAIQINTLANVLSSCINSTGGTYNDGSACGKLFYYSKPSYATPADTVAALVYILGQPTTNVAALFGLAPSQPPFQPFLTTAPPNWTLPIVQVSTPAFSPVSATYNANQAIFLTNTDPTAVMHYTIDGTTPTANSPVYSIPLLVIGSETIKALAIESGSVTSAVGSATYAISPGMLQLAATAYTVNETAGTVTLSVSRTGSLVGTAAVNYATSNGTAVAGTAYTARSGTLQWANQDAGSRTITVPITDQRLTTGSQNFTVSLSGATGDTLGSSTTSTVTIADNDTISGTIQLSAPKYITTEIGGALSVPVTRVGGISGAVSVTLASLNGTALASTDYTAVNTVVNWADGVGGTQNITVAILNPGIIGPPKTFSLLLSAATGGAVLGSPSTGIVTILDQPSTGKFWYVDAVNGRTSNNGKTAQAAFQTLQAGANAAGPGDTVLVANGTYTNSGGAALNFTTSGSAAGGYIAFEAAPGASPVIQVGPTAYEAVEWVASSYVSGGVTIYTAPSYIIFQGFTVMGSNANLTFAGAQSAQGPAGYQITANIVYNGSCISVTGNTKTTLQTGAVEPNHIMILDNTVAYCGSGGIGGGGSDYVTISGNTIYDSAWYTIYGSSAISLLGSYDTNPGDTSHRMVITNNVIYGNEEFIPWIVQGKITDGEAIILDSNLNASYSGGGLNYPPYGGRFLIANNVIYNDGSAAIEVFESSHVDIINNTTFNDNLNQATQPGRGELSISYNSTDVNIFNNIFYSSTAGTATPVSLTSGVSNINADYNIYYGGLANAWNGYGANGPHDTVVNPQYTSTPKPTLTGTNTPVPNDLLNAPAVNLQLQTTSPAIGSGTTTYKGQTAPSVDILGNPRPSANGYTRGAYSQ